MSGKVTDGAAPDLFNIPSVAPVVKIQDLPSKTAKIAFVKQKFVDDDRWLLRGLLAVYKNQTREEQSSRTATEANGVGFTGVDASYLTSLATQVIARGGDQLLKNPNSHLPSFLSSKQMQFLRKLMPKYAGQIVKQMDPTT